MLVKPVLGKQVALQITGRGNSLYRHWGRPEGSQTLSSSCFWVKHIALSEYLRVTAPCSASSQKVSLLLCREAVGNYRRALIAGCCQEALSKEGKAKGLRSTLEGGDSCVGWEVGVLQVVGMGVGH